MTANEARDRVKAFLGNAAPLLTDPEVDVFVSMAKVADRDGRGIDESGYVETYDLTEALALCWEAKSARASDYHDLDTEGAVNAHSQVYKHCAERAEYYRNKQGGAVGIGNLDDEWRRLYGECTL